jgi:hypothetical protein
MAGGGVVTLVANDGGRLSEALKCGRAGVPEKTMPGGWGRSGHKSAWA